MKKRIMMYILALCILAAVVMPAAAEEVTEPTVVTREPGWCGESITWSFDAGTLTITGEGKMDDFYDGAPWDAHKGEITRVVLTGGVTYIGACSFKNCDALTSVDFGESLNEIGIEAFFSCDGLTAIYLPSSFQIFAERSFQSCKNLTEIHSEGKAPKFRLNSMWETYATVYFPVNRPWSVKYIQELEEAMHGRIEFIASDGSDPYEPTEATQAPTEPETVPPTTEAPTEAPTEATEAPTEPPVTEAPTVPETEPVVTEAPTEPAAPTVPAEPEEMPGAMLFFVLLAVMVVLTLIIVVALIIKGSSRKGRFSA